MLDGETGLGGMVKGRAHATRSHLGLVALLMCFLCSSCFSCKNIEVAKILGLFELHKVLETLKYKKRRFSASQELNADKRDFVGKSCKSSKIAK
jgi:hypothetical protein